MDKLTHSGVYGVDETLNTVQDWLGIDLNYYVKMNFTAVRDIINAMGGVRVYSPVAFDSSLRNYHYDKGWNEIGGRQALFFARETCFRRTGLHQSREPAESYESDHQKDDFIHHIADKL